VFWPVEPAAAAQPPVSPGPGKVVAAQVGFGLAERIGAPLITYVGEQCLDDPLVAFFVDRVQPPAELRC